MSYARPWESVMWWLVLPIIAILKSFLVMMEIWQREWFEPAEASAAEE